MRHQWQREEVEDSINERSIFILSVSAQLLSGEFEEVMETRQWLKAACLQPMVLDIAPGVFSVEGCRQVRRRATNIALGQYWFLLLLHGFIPPGPGQNGVLLPWLEEAI